MCFCSTRVRGNHQCIVSINPTTATSNPHHKVLQQWNEATKNYTSVDPKQIIVSKFRLKPVILISECFVLDAATPTKTHPPHEGRRPFQSPRRRPHQPTPTPHMKGDNRRQRETRPLQSPRSRPHQPTPRRPDLKLH